MVVTPRDASTVMLVRDATPPPGIEVLMLRRSSRSVFAAGAHVFPGGAVDAGDAAPAVLARCSGRSDDEASARLGIPTGGLAFYVAAVRECFEESGVLLAARDGSGITTSGEEGRRLAEYRSELNSGATTFGAICEAESLVLSLGGLEYFSHWVTPVGAPRRYDTRFFVAAAPEGQVAAHDEGETTASFWLRPADALRRHREGNFDMLLPTLENLGALDRFERCDDLLAAARRAGTVPAMRPRLSAGSVAGFHSGPGRA